MQFAHPTCQKNDEEPLYFCEYCLYLQLAWARYYSHDISGLGEVPIKPTMRQVQNSSPSPYLLFKLGDIWMLIFRFAPPLSKRHPYSSHYRRVSLDSVVDPNKPQAAAPYCHHHTVPHAPRSPCLLSFWELAVW